MGDYYPGKLLGDKVIKHTWNRKKVLLVLAALHITLTNQYSHLFYLAMSLTSSSKTLT